MTPIMIAVVILLIINIGLMIHFTGRIIAEIQDNTLLSRGRVVYEDEQIGTLTAYSEDAILELIDGSVVVIPRMDEATE